MFKIVKKTKFSKTDNKLKNFGNIKEAIKYFQKGKNKNLYFALKQRFEQMYSFKKKIIL